ncbi:peptidase U32 family protein [Treponema pectinovorum]|uniref:peptidase U32 family protein n=1 Tax=Treponema pectinovorum TaxID=164 RepID=UPI0011C80C24|nr:peptidase U32 family protein [Treponema pectinovorum]
MSELLAPAGNIEALDAAIGEGADAVYLGLKSFNARLRSSNFAWNQFEAAVESLHRQNKKIYVTVNTVSEESETERLYRFLSYLNKIGPDGLIVQDYGVLRMCREFFPNLELHGSTQINVESAAGVKLLQNAGLKRVVVARELGLEEIRSIKQSTDCEIEMFVHGALCVSESGLCLFSSFLGGKSANRGMCTQACRRFYTADCDSGQKQGYYFSPSDLQLIEQIPDLLDMGVESFKIEGRMKSAEYVGAVTAAYRYLMDHYKEDKKGSIAAAKRMLSTDFARSKTTYWYNFKTNDDGVNNAGEAILNPNQAGGTGIYLGRIFKTKPATQKALENSKLALSSGVDEKDISIAMATLSGGSYEPDPGDSIRLHRKDDSGRESYKVRTVEVDDDGVRWIDIPKSFTRDDEVYLLQTKSMSKRYPRVLPQDIGKYRQQPGDEILPVMDLTPVARNELSYFPEGMYVQVSTIADLFQIQSMNPVRVILELNFETEEDLVLHKTVLPFSKKQVIISLPPYVPEATSDKLAKILEFLVEDGFKTFVVNNLAEVYMLKDKNVNMIAGSYLYTFNRWAVSWLENQNFGAFITPLENNRQNIIETFDKDVRERLLVTVYAYPALFRMRFRLPESYNFMYFWDKEEITFKVLSNKDGSVVMPEKPFSITEKYSQLQKDGIKRILIDFSRTKVTRAEVKTVLTSLIKGQVIPETSRFNWKDGFYNPEKMEAYKAAAERNMERKAEYESLKAGKGGSRGKNRLEKKFSNDFGNSNRNSHSKAKGRAYNKDSFSNFNGKKQ